MLTILESQLIWLATKSSSPSTAPRQWTLRGSFFELMASTIPFCRSRLRIRLPVRVMSDFALADLAVPERVVEVADDQLLASQGDVSVDQVEVPAGHAMAEDGRVLLLRVVVAASQIPLGLLAEDGFLVEDMKIIISCLPDLIDQLQRAAGSLRGEPACASARRRGTSRDPRASRCGGGY